MPDRDPPLAVTESRALPKKRTRFSLVWFIPIVAALVGAWVAVTRVLSEGPKITIVMKSAEGLEAGKTKVHYNGVDIGTVTTIELSEDHRMVTMTAQMAPKTEEFLVNDTKFWVVRPRISGANVGGLGTLISGAYIGVNSSSKTRCVDSRRVRQWSFAVSLYARSQQFARKSISRLSNSRCR